MLCKNVKQTKNDTWAPVNYDDIIGLSTNYFPVSFTRASVAMGGQSLHVGYKYLQPTTQPINTSTLFDIRYYQYLRFSDVVYLIVQSMKPTKNTLFSIEGVLMVL